MTITPAPQADMAVQVGHDREDVVGGGENTFGDLGDGRNLVETLHDFSDLAYQNDKPDRPGGNHNSFLVIVVVLVIQVLYLFFFIHQQKIQAGAMKNPKQKIIIMQ